MEADGAFSYKGWRVEVNSRLAPEGGGWRAYVDVTYDDKQSVRSVPLSFKDGRLFPSKGEADEAGAVMARTWIDEKS